MTRKHIVRVSIVAFWLLMMFWLVRFEAYPGYFTHALKGYDDIVNSDTLISDNWMRILQDGKPVGYTRTAVDVNEDESLRHIVFENRTHIRLELLGKPQIIQSLAMAWLDMMYRLQQFTFSMSTDILDIKVSGKRTRGERFELEIETAGSRRTMEVDIPDDVVIHSPLAAMAVKRMIPGEYVRVYTLNPVTLSREVALIRSIERETIVLAGKPVEATRLAIEYGGTTSDAWIDAEGHLLRQHTPLGWTLERTTAEEVFETTVGDDTRTKSGG